MIMANEAEKQILDAIERVLLSPERLATYVQEQQADSIEERERLQRELDGHRMALVLVTRNGRGSWS
jgi:hypothetical protein